MNYEELGKLGTLYTSKTERHQVEKELAIEHKRKVPKGFRYYTCKTKSISIDGERLGFVIAIYFINRNKKENNYIKLDLLTNEKTVYTASV